MVIRVDYRDSQYKIMVHDGCFQIGHAILLLCTHSHTAVIASLEVGVYDFSEGDGMVQVCALLLPPAPSGGLECSIVATLTLMDGLKAGTLRDYSYHYVLTTIDTTCLLHHLPHNLCCSTR